MSFSDSTKAVWIVVALLLPIFTSLVQVESKREGEREKGKSYTQSVPQATSIGWFGVLFFKLLSLLFCIKAVSYFF